MPGAPGAKQWKRIKERVAEIDGQVTTVHHYHDYWRPYLGVLYNGYAQSICGAQNALYNSQQGALNSIAQNAVEASLDCPQASLMQGAFLALGQADAVHDLN